MRLDPVAGQGSTLSHDKMILSTNDYHPSRSITTSSSNPVRDSFSVFNMAPKVSSALYYQVIPPYCIMRSAKNKSHSHHATGQNLRVQCDGPKLQLFSHLSSLLEGPVTSPMLYCKDAETSIQVRQDTAGRDPMCCSFS